VHRLDPNRVDITGAAFRLHSRLEAEMVCPVLWETRAAGSTFLLYFQTTLSPDGAQGIGFIRRDRPYFNQFF
jgi:hypothetical protein